MVKQHLEGILSRTLKSDCITYPEHKIWYMKIQNNPLAHKQTPADFIIITKDFNILIECKETKTDRFTFNRLTQEIELDMFNSIQLKNVSYILICFWGKRLKDSDIYLLDIKSFKYFKSSWSKNSITRQEAKNIWSRFTIAKINKEKILYINRIYADMSYINCGYNKPLDYSYRNIMEEKK